MHVLTFDIDVPRILSYTLHLAAAYVLALPMGWDREVSRRRFGLRTFPLVALASCGFMLCGLHILDSTEAEARVLQGIITGIGFIGGGAILKSDGNVMGTATAASIWNTGAIGVAVANDRFEIAILLSIFNFATLRVVGILKPKLEEKQDLS